MQVEGFEAWYRTQHPRLLAALRVRCGNERLAREGLDEACSRALERWERVGEMAQPAGWVYQVALNQIRRTERRRAIEARLLRRQPQPAPLELTSDVDLWTAVRRLPARQRDVIVLRFLLDLSEMEIAAVLGISRGAVSASTTKARTALAASLGSDTAEVKP